MSIAAMCDSFSTHTLTLPAMIRFRVSGTDCGRQGQPVKCSMIGLSGLVFNTER